MPHEDLDRILNQLQSELSDADSLSPAQVERLRQLVEEIELSIQKADADDGSLARRLRHAVRDFEDSHPQLTNTVGQVADILAQMGF